MKWKCFCKEFCKKLRKKKNMYLEHQTLGQWDNCPIDIAYMEDCWFLHKGASSRTPLWNPGNMSSFFMYCISRISFMTDSWVVILRGKYSTTKPILEILYWPRENSSRRSYLNLSQVIASHCKSWQVRTFHGKSSQIIANAVIWRLASVRLWKFKDGGS